MRKIGNYLWNLVIFLITPFLLVAIESTGVQVPDSGPGRREYSRSVSQRVNVVCILCILVAVVFLASETVIAAVLVSLTLIAVCIALLTPQVLLSYETVNWWKIASLQRQFRKCRKPGTYEKGEMAQLIFEFLSKEAMVTDVYGYHHWDRFNHLLHICRTCGYWKDTRKELLERCRIEASLVED